MSEDKKQACINKHCDNDSVRKPFENDTWKSFECDVCNHSFGYSKTEDRYSRLIERS